MDSEGGLGERTGSAFIMVECSSWCIQKQLGGQDRSSCVCMYVGMYVHTKEGGFHYWIASVQPGPSVNFFSQVQPGKLPIGRIPISETD